MYLTEQDLGRAAAFLGLSQRAFERRYVYRTRHLLRLRKPRNSECPFLEAAGCAIHPAKPTQCSAFPFWPEHVENRKGWRVLRTACPGVGQGALVPLQAVQRIANGMREAYPEIYPAMSLRP